MASSTNNSPRKIARQSSLLGTIKNIVAAPLTWLAGAESDDNDNSDSTGKRRRLEPVSEAANVDDGDGTARVKRMRVHSPPAVAQPSPYLDPPSAAFHQYRPKRRTPALPLARSSSVSANTLDPSRNVRRNLSRATLSPIRLGRTMSIDPPLSQLHISRDTSMHDVVMESGQGTLNRERSLPAGALTARPSFRMRTSITPQPQREVSEPPALNSLILNPTFVRPPPAVQESRLPTTLGSLVETVRSAKSPVRQHSSLLFATAQPEPIQQLVQQVAVQKALHELDIYKTPLVPTRLRTANNPIASTSSDIPAMFKSRRSSQLVLMDDDRRSEKAGKKGRLQKSPHRNDSKPYAGAGGMKKLLARRKQEVVEKEEKGKDDEMDGTSALQVPSLPPTSTNAAAAPVDWFAAASAGTTLPASGSSLRVGRNKTSRNHIERPAARGRHKFSAVYEEEDDSMDPDEELRRQERAALEEAAKKIPAFEIPAGFSFAKPDAKPLQQDLTNAKEPPIPSLPFSFAKPVQVPEPSKAESSQSRKENSEASTASIEKGPELSFGLPQLPTPSLSDAAPLGSAEWGNERNATAPPTGLGSGLGGVPNFFAKSSVLAKPLDMPPTLPSTFPPPAPAPASGSLFGVSQTSPTPLPVNDKENPFWECEKKEKEKDTSTPEIKITAPPVPPASSGFSFASSTTSPPAAFSFSKPAPAMPAFGSVTQDVTNAPPKALADAPVETVKQGFGTAPLTMPLFTPPVQLPPAESKLASAPGVSQPSTNLFGLVESKPLFDSPKPAEKSAPVPSLFSFGPAAMTTVEAPKPTFPAANSTPFTFGAPEKDATPKPSPFSFGAVPSTPPTNTVNGFSFKTDVPAASPSPVPFSFSATNPSSSSGAAKPFTFGATNSAIERPKTPENKDQEFRMEESPTRELQTSGSSKPSLSFSFGMPAANGSSSSLFSTVTPASPVATPSSSFSFGATTTPNPFGAPIKPEEPSQPNSFSFGNTSSTPTGAAPAFSFGPSKSTDPQRPNTAGSFGFGAPTPTSTAAPFSFGTSAAPPNPFAPAATSSAPSSPSTFNQPSPFSFNQPLPATSSTPFTFGSQPASPVGSSSGLPTTGGFGSTNGTFGAAPSSPFGSPAQLAPSTSSGGTLFTIGAAPTPQPPGGGPRQIRKLPSRRPGGAKPR